MSPPARHYCSSLKKFLFDGLATGNLYKPSKNTKKHRPENQICAFALLMYVILCLKTTILFLFCLDLDRYKHKLGQLAVLIEHIRRTYHLLTAVAHQVQQTVCLVKTLKRSKFYFLLLCNPGARSPCTCVKPLPAGASSAATNLSTTRCCLFRSLPSPTAIHTLLTAKASSITTINTDFFTGIYLFQFFILRAAASHTARFLLLSSCSFFTAAVCFFHLCFRLLLLRSFFSIFFF